MTCLIRSLSDLFSPICEQLEIKALFFVCGGRSTRLLFQFLPPFLIVEKNLFRNRRVCHIFQVRSRTPAVIFRKDQQVLCTCDGHIKESEFRTLVFRLEIRLLQFQVPPCNSVACLSGHQAGLFVIEDLPVHGPEIRWEACTMHGRDKYHRKLQTFGRVHGEQKNHVASGLKNVLHCAPGQRFLRFGGQMLRQQPER